MPLSSSEIGTLLQPYLVGSVTDVCAWPRVYDQLARYLELLLKWNARMNLTAIREPHEIVRRHFGESLFAGLHLCSTWNTSLAQDCATSATYQPPSLLDFGSGAGFPGLPIQILRPELPITLAEAQKKKAAFLREVIRSLGLATQVWPERAETMPSDRQFTFVTLRAVDNMIEAIGFAAARASELLAILGTRSSLPTGLAGGFGPPTLIPLPQSEEGMLAIYKRVPSQKSLC